MAYTVSFGTINKKENSTSRSYTEVLSASCVLKESTDVLRPTVSLAAQIVTDELLRCNYMFIGSFHRYYWITGINFIHGSWYVSGEVDVLASFKTAIGNTKAYILRSASSYDEYVPDRYFPFQNDAVDSVQTWNVGFDGSDGGTILISCAGSNNGVDTECYYALVDYMWYYIYSTCFTNGFLTDLDNAWSGLSNLALNGIVRPEDYISAAIWLPINYTDIPGVAQNIYLGFTRSNAVGKPISPSTLLFQDENTFTIPDHPQIGTYGKWLNGNMSRFISCFLPGYGTISLDSDLAIESGSTVNIKWAVDCSGVIDYAVTQGYQTQHFTTNISTPVGWSVSRSDIMSAFSNAAGAVGSLAMGNVGHSMSNIGNAIESAFPHVERICSGGSRVLPSLAPSIRINTKSYILPANLDFTSTGRPLATMKQISTLSGYILCDNSASVSCPGTKEEIEKINSYLSGGFYYE